MKINFFGPRYENVTDERGKAILGKAYERAYNISKLTLAIITLIFFLLSFKNNENAYSAYQVALLTCGIAFLNHVTFVSSVKGKAVFDKNLVKK